MNQLQYLILPGHNFSGPQKKDLRKAWALHYDSFFDTWKKSWDHTFSELKSNSQAQNNDFLRQTILAGLFNGVEVVALQTSTFFDLRWRAHSTHPYFRLFPESFWKEAELQQRQQFMTIEYLYVSPLWRKSLQSASLSDVLMCLSLQIMNETSADAMLGVPRADRKVNEAIYKRGAIPISQNLDLHNVKVDLIQFLKGDFIRDPTREEDHLIDHYWENRIDLSNLTTGDIKNFNLRMGNLR